MLGECSNNDISFTHRALAGGHLALLQCFVSTIKTVNAVNIDSINL